MVDGLGDLAGGPGAPGNEDLNIEIIVLDEGGGVPPSPGDFIMIFVRNQYYL